MRVTFRGPRIVQQRGAAGIAVSAVVGTLHRSQPKCIGCAGRRGDVAVEPPAATLHVATLPLRRQPNFQVVVGAGFVTGTSLDRDALVAAIDEAGFDVA